MLGDCMVAAHGKYAVKGDSRAAVNVGLSGVL